MEKGAASRGPTKEELDQLMPLTEANSEMNAGGWVWVHPKVAMKWLDYAVKPGGRKRYLPHAGEGCTLKCRLCGGNRSTEEEVVGEGAVPFKDLKAP